MIRRLLALVLVGVALGGLSASAGGTTRRAGYRILLTSNRDGRMRGYSMRPDGSRLTPLLARGRALMPQALSRDGGTIAYGAVDPEHNSGVYVSRADGSGLHRVVPKPASAQALSPDGKLLAFSGKGPGIWIVGTDGRGVYRLTLRDDSGLSWSPDGKSVSFVRSVGVDAGVLVVWRLDGKGRVLARGELADPDSGQVVVRWSADGRWIAYLLTEHDKTQLWAVRPDGTRWHRVALDASAFDWSPHGTRLAFKSRYGKTVGVVGLDGRGRRFGFARVPVSDVSWLPNGGLALVREDGQIWIVGHDGRGLRRLTREGANGLLGWTRLAPARPPAAPLPKTERIVGRRTLTLRAPVTSLAADGARVAFTIGSTTIDCKHVAVWTPAAGSVARPPLPSPCGESESDDRLERVALAGARVAWSVHDSYGHRRDSYVIAAELPELEPPFLDVANATVSGDVGGTEVGDPVGDGTLLAFTVRDYCDLLAMHGECPPGTVDDVTSTTLWRVGGHGDCPGDLDVGETARACTAVAKSVGRLDLLAVDAGRIVVGTKSAVEILDATGRVLHAFPVTAKAAALSGNRLAVQTAAGVDVYDTTSGERVAQLPAVKGVQDLESGILVTASGSVVTLRRLADGRTTTFQVTGKARAQLEPAGLFVAGDRRITFTPMRELVALLGGDA